HIVLRAERSVLRHPRSYGPVNSTIEHVCKKHGVRLYRYANVGNHLHFLVKIPGRRQWAGFIRELTGRIAQLVQGMGLLKHATKRFWKQRPFTRIVRGWQKAFQTMKDYIELNRLEAEGHISRKETKNVRDLRAFYALFDKS